MNQTITENYEVQSLEEVVGEVKVEERSSTDDGLFELIKRNSISFVGGLLVGVTAYEFVNKEIGDSIIISSALVVPPANYLYEKIFGEVPPLKTGGATLGVVIGSMIAKYYLK